VAGYFLYHVPFSDITVNHSFFMTIHVSNVGCHVSSADLYQLFAAVGNVASARIITDKETGKSLRYGFVEMTDEKSVAEAISKLHGKVIEGRAISVAISKNKNAQPASLRTKPQYSSFHRPKRFV
jgi:RNA recognition motif-containing protein